MFFILFLAFVWFAGCLILGMRRNKYYKEYLDRISNGYSMKNPSKLTRDMKKPKVKR